MELKGVRSGVEWRRGASGLKARGGGRRETTGKVLKKRRSPRERGRMGTSVYRTRLSVEAHRPLVEERDVIRALLRREAFDEALVHLRGAAQHVQVLAHRGENLRSLDLDGDVRVRARELRAIPYKAMSGWSSQASEAELKGAEDGDCERGVGAERRREKSLRIGVHHADAVVWEPVYRTHLGAVHLRERRGSHGRLGDLVEELPQRPP